MMIFNDFSSGDPSHVVPLSVSLILEWCSLISHDVQWISIKVDWFPLFISWFPLILIDFHLTYIGFLWHSLIVHPGTLLAVWSRLYISTIISWFSCVVHWFSLTFFEISMTFNDFHWFGNDFHRCSLVFNDFYWLFIVFHCLFHDFHWFQRFSYDVYMFSLTFTEFSFWHPPGRVVPLMYFNNSFLISMCFSLIFVDFLWMFNDLHGFFNDFQSDY